MFEMFMCHNTSTDILIEFHNQRNFKMIYLMAIFGISRTITTACESQKE